MSIQGGRLSRNLVSFVCGHSYSVIVWIRTLRLALTLIGWIGLLTLIAWCFTTKPVDGIAKPVGWLWWALTTIVLLCFRWPLVLAPFEFNPDEAQMIAGALTLRHDPVFWRSVDGITAGPMDFFPLLPATLRHGLASFTIERLIGLAGMVGSWIFVGEALAILSGKTVARAAVLPALASNAFIRTPEFLYYSTEIAPLFLLSASTWFAARQQRAVDRRNLWLIGLLLGSVPWSKLQATPIAAVLWILVLVFELRNQRVRSISTLLLFGFLPSLAFVGMAAATGQTHHMLISYVLNNFGYVQGAPLTFAATCQRQWMNTMTDSSLGLWIIGAFAYALMVWLLVRRPSDSAKTWTVAGMALLAVSLTAILMPRRDTAHYLYFLELPLLIISGGTLAMVASWKVSAAQRRSSAFWIRIFILVTVVPQVAWTVFHIPPAYESDPATLSSARKELTSILQEYGRAGEPLGVWGWRSALYVDTGMIQATREGQSQPQINLGRWQLYFRQRFMKDLTASEPPIFVDTVGPGNFISNRTYAHESFPALVEWLDRSYAFVLERSGVRIYVRKDRLNRAQPATGL